MLVFTDIYIKLNVVFVCTYNFRMLNFLLFEIDTIYKMFTVNQFKPIKIQLLIMVSIECINFNYFKWNITFLQIDIIVHLN